MCLACPIPAAELCHEFDDNANMITVDCVTGERIITQADIDRENRAKEEAIRQQKALEQKQNEEKQRQQQAEQKRQEKMRKQRQQEQRKLNNQKMRRQAAEGKRVQIDGKDYYLYEKPVRSQTSGIRSGDWMISLAGGGGAYLKAPIDTGYGITDMKGTRNGGFWSASLSGMKFINSYFGIGLAVETNQHLDASSNISFYAAGEGGRIKPSIKTYNFMLLGRVNLNPAHAARLYIPFGIGYAAIKEKRSSELYHWYPYYVEARTDNYSDSSLSYFGGIGLEFDLTECVSLGLEGRYNKFSYKKQPFSYANGLLKVNVKF